MRLPHPLLHIGTLPYVATILGRAKGRLFICPFLAVSIFVLLPDFCRGVFAFICSQEFSAVNLPNTSKIMLADNRIYFVKFALNE